MNLAQLRAFHAVASEGSFTKAARVLGVKQPTLSKEVKELETGYDVALLERSGGAIGLTELGGELFAVTSRLFSAQREAAELLDGNRRLRGGSLNVGADGPHHAVPLIAAFSRRHPGPRVRLSVGNGQAILRAFLEARLDVALLANAPGDPRFYVEPLWRDPVLLLVPTGHLLAELREVHVRLLAGERLLLREVGSTTRRIVEAGLAAAEVTPAGTLELEGREAIAEGVAAGLGLGFVIATEAPRDPRLVARPIVGCRLEMDEYVVCMKERRRLAVVRAFLEVAAEARAARAAAS